MARSYSMATREEARRRTRESILDAAVANFGDAWYDDITLASVARAAGVSQQTLTNHFGSKLQLYLAAVAERSVPEMRRIRDRVVAGDVRSVVGCVVDDYELSGAGTVRALALADREPDLREMLAAGAAYHRDWVERALAPQLAKRRGRPRERLATLLVVALEVRTWEQLRRGQGLSREETVEHLAAMVTALTG
ncbi:MAG: helix-turn-helix transcriptional regulator [Nocardioidaceae bacterium]|nr:helix-turn-helix transcriptional regulator [Nocardioidaceae bacterium]